VVEVLGAVVGAAVVGAGAIVVVVDGVVTVVAGAAVVVGAGADVVLVSIDTVTFGSRTNWSTGSGRPAIAAPASAPTTTTARVNSHVMRMRCASYQRGEGPVVGATPTARQ
jgi:hypothetical protein